MKSLTSGGVGTKVVALGIGDGVDENELRDMASSPRDRNVILVQDFNDLTSVEDRLRNESCTGKYVYFAVSYCMLGSSYSYHHFSF